MIDERRRANESRHRKSVMRCVCKLLRPLFPFHPSTRKHKRCKGGLFYLTDTLVIHTLLLSFMLVVDCCEVGRLVALCVKMKQPHIKKCTLHIYCCPQNHELSRQAVPRLPYWPVRKEKCSPFSTCSLGSVSTS